MTWLAGLLGRLLGRDEWVESDYSESHGGHPRLFVAGLVTSLVVAVVAWQAVTFAQRLGSGAMATVTVRGDGLYYLDSDGIASALGLGSGDVPWLVRFNQIEIANRGKAVPVLPAPGNAGVYFYGQANDPRYSVENVYWLRVGGGLQMATVGAPPSGSPSDAFEERRREEQDNPSADMLFLTRDAKADYIAWQLLAANKGDDPANCDRCKQEFEVGSPGATRSGTASIVAHLLGATQGAAGNDHRAVLAVNGTKVGEGSWSGETSYDLSATFDAALLKDGPNAVQVTALLDQGVQASAIFVDSFDVTYRRQANAPDGKLVVRNAVGSVAVDGFGSKDVLLVDVTDPGHPASVTGATIGQSGSGYKVSFSSGSADRRYLVESAAAVAKAKPERYVPAGLKSERNGANYVVITTAPLKAAAERLAAYRESRGMRSKVVDVQDVYDEFGGGIAHPEAIRAFLAYAQANWHPAPKYAVLAGGGTFEYNSLGGEGNTLLPVWMTATPEGLYASDNWFGDVSGSDGAPEVAVGRIPVSAPEELLGYLEKVKSFEASKDRLSKVLLLADRPDRDMNFPDDSDTVGGLVPRGSAVQKVYLSERGDAEAHDLAVSAIRGGATLVNYVGHGSIDRFAGKGLLTTKDAEGALDAPVSPVFAAMTCLPNLFYVPGAPALSDALVLRKGGGATAVWGPTGQSDNDEAAVVNRAFFRAVFGTGPVRLGDAATAALKSYAAAGGKRWMLDIFELLGDPALELR